MCIRDRYRILVQGAPALPAAEAKEKTTTVKGRIIEKGAPVANTKVQLCAESPSLFINESPCEGQAFQKIVETDADGKFSFENVPLATYGIAALNGEGKWIIFLSDIAGRADDSVDLGDVDVTKE